MTGRLTTGDTRVLTRIEYDRRDRCWLWQGGHGARDGRPRYEHSGTGEQLVSRIVYRIFFGAPVPEGWHLHHECENPRCVNPWHLRPLTPPAHNQVHRRLRSECKNGHAYTPENTGWVTRQGGKTERYCKACHRERQARRAGR